MALTLSSRVRLNNGVEMPYLGLGVWRMPPGPGTRRPVSVALEAGYRLLDTAKLYRNEADVGQAVRESGVPRDEVFVTTKLWNSDHGYDETLRACEHSLRELGLDYVDLYLVHWPEPRKRHETWRAMETLYERGWARAIGVSNYMIPHLAELLREAKVVPAVDQVELTPFLNQAELLAFCRRNGIQPEAYSPLTKGRRLGDRRIAAVAARYGRTPAQVLLRWCLEKEAVVIPKASQPEHIRENGRIFDFSLAPEDRRTLDSLDEGLHMDWDPTGTR